MNHVTLSLIVIALSIFSGISGCEKGREQQAIKATTTGNAISSPPQKEVEAINPKDVLNGTTYKGLSAYYDHMDAGRYRDARNLIIFRFSASDPNLRKLVDDAEIKDYLRIIDDPKADKQKKDEALVGLSAQYPEHATPYKDKVLAAEKALVRAREAQTDAIYKKHAAKLSKGGVSIGMSSDEVVLTTWGRPSRINRSTSIYGVREQWVYGGGNYLYFQNGILTEIQN